MLCGTALGCFSLVILGTSTSEILNAVVTEPTTFLAGGITASHGRLEKLISGGGRFTATHAPIGRYQ
jgi:hypothetical protein